MKEMSTKIKGHLMLVAVDFKNENLTLTIQPTTVQGQKLITAYLKGKGFHPDEWIDSGQTGDAGEIYIDFAGLVEL